MDYRFEQRQQQTLSPRLQQAVRLLQLSSPDFAQEVNLALGRNPFLEVEDGEDSDGDADDAASLSLAGHVDTLPGGDDAQDEGAGGGGDDRDLLQFDGLARHRHTDDEVSALDFVAAHTTLADHLHAQLLLLPLGTRDRLLAQVLIDSLDDDGYLRTPLVELLPLAGLDPVPALPEMELALHRVQALEPAGVGARGVAECLRQQLPAIECPDRRGVAAAIIDNHLDLLAARDVAGMARALGRSRAEIDDACERIRHFDPRPGWRHDASDTQYLVPDVVVRKVRGAWTVQLNPAVVPRVKLNQFYAELFQRSRRRDRVAAPSAAQPHGELAGHLQEARWTVRNVEQRFSTILDVAQAIVRRQKHFFDLGPMAMKPLGLREIADELGMHESTVSRVTNNKYLAAPLGVFELKQFFSRTMVSASGHACSCTAIRGLIQDMIEGEDRRTPLSDAEITRQLARQGLTVARRTVTKYRQLLRIEPVQRRRRSAICAELVPPLAGWRKVPAALEPAR